MPLPWPLSAPWPSLSIPTGFSFAQLSDTRHWQRRLLRYVIRRTLGGILQLPEESIEEHTHLDADLGSGNVQLKNVKLDATAINAQLATCIDSAGLPLHVELIDGSIGAVQLLLGNTTDDGTPARTLSATERLFTAPIQLTISEAVLELRVRALERSSNKDSSQAPVHGLDLATSIVNVAEGYIDETLQQDSAAIEDEEDPFALPGAFDRPSSDPHLKDEEQVGMVAAIIERILARLQISVQDLRLRIHLASVDSVDLADLEFRLEKANSQTIVQQGEKGTSFVRMLSMTDPSIWFRESLQAGDYSSPSSPNAGSPDTSVSDDMAMSMAIADLRTSQMPERLAANTSPEASQSMYYSTDFDSINDNSPMTDATPTKEPPKALDKDSSQTQLSNAWIQLFGAFPTELVSEVTARFTASSEHGSASSRLEFTAPRLGFLVTPSAISALARFANKLLSSRSQSSNNIQAARQSDPANLLLYTRITGLELFAPLLDNSGNPSLSLLMSSTSPPDRTVHLALHEIEGAYRISAAEGKIAIKRYCFAIQDASSFRPLVMPDPGLIWAYSAANLKHGDSIPSGGDWRESTSQPSRPQDWRIGVPVNASSLNAQSKTPVLSDSIAVRVSREACKITLQPVHVWADASLLNNLCDALATYASAVAWSSSQETASASPYADNRKTARSLAITLEVACLRLDLRVPNPATQILRAGIITLDLHDLSVMHPARPSPSTQVSQRARFDEDISPLEVAEVNFQSIFGFVASLRPSKNGAVCFLTARSASFKALLRRLQTTSEHGSSVLRAKVIIPIVGAFIDKAVNDSLQFLADDISRTLSGHAAGTTQADKISSPASPSRRIKQPASSISTFSGSSQESDRTSNTQHVVGGIDLSVLEAHVQLSTCKDVAKGADILLRATDIHAQVELRHNGSEDLVIDLSADSASVLKTGNGSTEMHLLRKLAQSTLPVLKLRLTSSVESQTQAKHSRIRLVANSFVYDLSSDLEWATQLADTFKAPAGVFTDVVPNDSTKIDVIVNESIIRLLPLDGQSALAISLGHLRYQVQLFRDEIAVKGHAALQETEVWVADHAVTGNEGVHSLKSLGYARFAALSEASCRIVHNATPDTRLDMTAKTVRGRIEACPDTLLVLSQVLQAIVPTASGSSQTRHVAPLAELSGSICLPRQGEGSDHPPLPNRSIARQVVSEEDGITLTSLGHGKTIAEEAWFADKQTPSKEKQPTPSFRFRLQNAALTLSLYEGYDFERSRKFVKDTVKATRKRLEKIRQLLAEGQVPDETVEEAAESLLQSVFLPPRQEAKGPEADDLDTFERIAAFDDELDKDDVTTYSWETVQQRPNMRRTFSNSSARQTGAHLRRLRRPKTSALDINLTGLSSSFNLYGDTSALASRVGLEIRELGIIDNLRTSSWNKFLTELRPRDGGIIRPTNSPMVKVKLSMVKGADSPEQQEANLKVKVCPLRLHIDQDALDFLKAFAAFKMDAPVTAAAPTKAAPSPSDSKPNSGFVQRVEIFPIKIKLDYKPKRVDYQALRQGRTIELMNFFSFEASEMVLRHLVLNGVPSWAKVGDLLQDIWTPDVKANQLADFLAGINPVRSVVNVGSGVADLVLLPVQQYKKDGRLVRGVQRGSKSFAKTTALEAIKLGARMATGTQVILERAERVLGGKPPQGGSPVTTPSHQELFLEDMEEEDESMPDTTETLSRFSKQPTDVREGIQTAYKSLSGNMRTAAETILAVPMEVYEHSDEGPARAVVRAVPIAVLRPMIGASEAVSKTLLGLRNTLDPGARGEIQDKYKRPSSSS